MIRVEGIPIVAARLAEAEKSQSCENPAGATRVEDHYPPNGAVKQRPEVPEVKSARAPAVRRSWRAAAHK
ncbi:MAG TPA: hypothetical protein VE422_39855 [Terriglobia bacterium]|nr:hypothetical protein [Terriglobia bacterium]